MPNLGNNIQPTPPHPTTTHTHTGAGGAHMAVTSTRWPGLSLRFRPARRARPFTNTYATRRERMASHASLRRRRRKGASLYLGQEREGPEKGFRGSGTHTSAAPGGRQRHTASTLNRTVFPKRRAHIHTHHTVQHKSTKKKQINMSHRWGGRRGRTRSGGTMTARSSQKPSATVILASTCLTPMTGRRRLSCQSTGGGHTHIHCAQTQKQRPIQTRAQTRAVAR